MHNGWHLEVFVWNIWEEMRDEFSKCFDGRQRNVTVWLVQVCYTEATHKLVGYSKTGWSHLSIGRPILKKLHAWTLENDKINPDQIGCKEKDFKREGDTANFANFNFQSPWPTRGLHWNANILHKFERNGWLNMAETLGRGRICDHVNLFYIGALLVEVKTRGKKAPAHCSHSGIAWWL